MFQEKINQVFFNTEFFSVAALFLVLVLWSLAQQLAGAFGKTYARKSAYDINNIQFICI